MSKISVHDPDDLDLEEYALMQKEAFKDLLDEMGVSDSFMTPDFYKWKYKTPYGNARIVTSRIDEKLVSSTMIQPTKIKYKGASFKAWQNGDTATIKEYRNIGLYPRCMKAVIRELGENDLIFGFPNKNSVRGFSFFVEYNKGVVPLLARFSLLPNLLPNRMVFTINRFEDHDINWLLMQNDKSPIFSKNSVWLDWRYTDHPVHKYSKHILKDEKGIVSAVVVTRNAIIAGKKVLLIMEVMGTSISQIRKILQTVIPQQKNGPYVLSFNNMFTFSEALYLGFVSVPDKFIPKQQLLFVLAKGDAKVILPPSWQLQMGDWDGF